MALRRADVVLAPSKYTADHVAAIQRVANQKIRVLPWALDPQFEALAPQSGKAAAPENFPEGRVVLNVGRWRADERYKRNGHVDHGPAAIAATLGRSCNWQL